MHSENPWELLDVLHILRKLKVRRCEALHFELCLERFVDEVNSELVELCNINIIIYMTYIYTYFSPYN